LIRKLLTAAVITTMVAIALLTTHAASAHTRPIRFDPAPGAVLASAPSKVDAWFTNPMRRDPNWNFLKVTDAQGNRVDVGEPVLSPDRRQMTVNLQPGLAAGRYIVNWAGWDDNDGHILGDCFTFYVGQAAADAGISDRARLDGGNTCQRLDVSARDGTPSPAQLTPVAVGTPQAGGTVGPGGSNVLPLFGEDEDDGVPVWALVAGIIAGLAVGGVGGRMVSGRA
jgi:methionine-rich copper-binding protein CopC